MLTTHRIVVATVNSEKFAVFEQLLASERDIVLARADAVRNPEKLRFVVDWRRPCLENAISKARALGQASHSPVLSETGCIELGEGDERIVIPDDDLDLCYSERVGGSPLAQVTGLLNGKPARAILDSAAVLLIEGVMVKAFEKIQGTVLPQARGKLGCSFDSIFIPQGEYRTLAEMCSEDRSRYSPRDRAVRKVMKEMIEDGLMLVKPQAG